MSNSATTTAKRACSKQMLSRRAAAAAAMVAPFTIKMARGDTNSAAVLAGIIQRTEQQAAAFNSGDMERWFKMTNIADDFTLLAPFGGPAHHGFDKSPEYLARLSKLFRNGDAKLEVAQAYASEDLIVLVFIERGHGEVHGLQDQEWPLRVTQVYRRDGSEWQLVHRHADPLSRRLTLERTAALARGEGASQ